MDDTNTSTVDSPSSDSAAAAPVRPSVRRSNRLGKGLSSLYQTAPAPKTVVVESAPLIDFKAEEPTDTVTATLDREECVATPQAAEEAPVARAAVEPVDDPRNLYDADRLHRLIERMEAVCSLVIDAERLQQRHVRRALTVAWSAAAVLAAVCGVVLWSAGSGAAWNRAQVEQARGDTASARSELVVVQAQVTQVRGEAQRLARELETLRSALSKANGVIDQLMTAPPAAEQATGGR